MEKEKDNILTTNPPNETTIRLSQDDLQFIKSIPSSLGFLQDTLNQLCSSEKGDIEYGFELGKVYIHLSGIEMDLMEVLSNLK